MKRISSALLTLAILCMQSPSSARELREYTLKKKIDTSDLIFVGNVLAIERPKQETEGVQEFAVVRVTESIKGAEQGKELRFVVKGSIGEDSPDCCLVGSDYLFFSKDGVQILTLEGSSIGGKIDLQGKYVSPSNGKFSTYPIVSGLVRDWPGKDLGPAEPLASVRKEICEALRESKGTEVSKPLP
ncbi:hypothetical protein [Cognatiluteimonas telluris]|uniref:hypothetical protein n=1 Tax=Cognatiluteimonas telluris TaxID=1104775 RepID=UPI00140DF97A|nr:hypothetical protein [Lysobacter telluris]